MEKKKAVDEAVKAASAVKDHLSSFPPFCQYDRNGNHSYLILYDLNKQYPISPSLSHQIIVALHFHAVLEVISFFVI